MEAMEAIDRELERLHKELASYSDPDCSTYELVLDEIGRVNTFLMEVARAQLTSTKEKAS